MIYLRKCELFLSHPLAYHSLITVSQTLTSAYHIRSSSGKKQKFKPAHPSGLLLNVPGIAPPAPPPRITSPTPINTVSTAPDASNDLLDDGISYRGYVSSEDEGTKSYSDMRGNLNNQISQGSTNSVRQHVQFLCIDTLLRSVHV